MSQYPADIQKIQDSEAVSAAVANRPLTKLSQRTDYLKAVLDNERVGKTLLDRSVPISANASVGYAVYLDSDGVYKPALAETQLDTDHSRIEAGPKAHVAGVVVSKTDSNTGNVALSGRIELDATALAAAYVDGTVQTGQVYLSSVSSQAGLLTTQNPAISVPVMYVTGPNASGNYEAILNPSGKDLFAGHTHTKYPLTAVQAADSTEAGWLPATDAIFNGKAPSGAAWGYNISQDSELSKIWPPVPIGAVDLTYKGLSVPLEGSNQIAQVDENGIWWWSDTNLPFGTASGSSLLDEIWVNLWLARLATRDSTQQVLSLDSTGNIVRVVDASTGATATTGHLTIESGFEIDTSDTTLAGDTAVKSAVDGTLKAGPIVEALVAGTNVTLTGTDHPSISGGKYGTVTVDTAIALLSEGKFDIVSLDSISVEDYNDLSYYGFSNDTNRIGVIVLSVGLPRISQPATFDIAARFGVLARATGTMPDLPVDYRLIPPVSSPGAMPTSWTSLGNLALSGVGSVTAGDYFQIDGPTLNGIVPGSVLMLRITRDPSAGGDTFAGTLGLYDIRWEVQ